MWWNKQKTELMDVEWVVKGWRHAKYDPAFQHYTRTSNDELLNRIHTLKDAVARLKANGITMWNYKQAIPQIFDIVDGAFFIMTELIENQKEKTK